MGSKIDFVNFIVDQIKDAGVITYRKMFGEYVIYCDGKVVALVCDNKLFVKPTQGGRAYIGSVVEAPAYGGSKLSFLIEDKVEDSEYLSELIRLTAKELLPPKAKGKKAR
jgi:TfoX/Sxy family transcriptional regulator of competence genes